MHYTLELIKFNSTCSSLLLIVTEVQLKRFRRYHNVNVDYCSRHLYEKQHFCIPAVWCILHKHNGKYTYVEYHCGCIR